MTREEVAAEAGNTERGSRVQEDFFVYHADDMKVPFVKNDLLLLAERYGPALLLATKRIEDRSWVPPNITVVDEFIRWERFRPGAILLRNLFPLLGIYVRECIASRRLLPVRGSFAKLVSNVFKAEEALERQRAYAAAHGRSGTPFHFEHWFYDCVHLAWLRKKGHAFRAFARSHSGDLFEEHYSLQGKVLFRHFQFRELDAVWTDSKRGEIYLRERYPGARAEIATRLLGCEDKGRMSPFDPGTLSIVSVASIRHHKRIHRIAEALLHVDVPVTWYHFGHERLGSADPSIPLYVRNKEALMQRPNVRYVPMGFVDNEQVMEFYARTPVSLFISLSEYEGTPVSMMEASSHGIPILATAAGGCNEIANEHTGRLIPIDTPVEEVAAFLDAFPTSQMNTLSFRQGVRDFWSGNYDRKAIYAGLFTRMDELLK